MSELIAYCGLDCEKCDARIATITEDDDLRQEVAVLWTKLNQVEITPSMIHCMGCRTDGVKTVFCENMCEIRQCAQGKGLDSCKACSDVSTCQKIKMITDKNDEARERLQL